jgi:glycosyltransferase involved in cell wall biosynthesis
VPVLATDVGEARRICGDAGIVFPAGSRDAMRDALQRFGSDAALRGALSERALARASSMPTWSDAVSRWDEIVSGR